MLTKEHHRRLSVFCVPGVCITALLLLTPRASADVVNVMVGDADGFGIGCSDTGTCTAALSSPPIDNRSASEKVATNGAQFTDVYSALYSGNGPNGNSGDILFPFSGTLTSGSISFAAGDFQSDVFGPLTASINGVSIPFNYADGRYVTAIHTIALTSAELAAANAVGYVDLNLNRGSSGDYIAFDYFQLTGESTATPEPSSLLLLATGVFGVAGLVKRRFA